jgi:DNA ligase (NAD+)
MDKKALAARVTELAEIVQYHSDLYFNKANPEITDPEFDSFVEELKTYMAELEQQDSAASEIVQGKEVLNNIGATPSYGSKVTHSQVMGSLDKSKADYTVEDWYAKYATKGGKIVVMPKIDGCAVRLNYKDGRLAEAATRGDGKVGQDVTDNVRATKSIPKFIGGGKTLEIRSEVIMPRSVFKRLTENGVKGANPRNLGTGSLMAQDPQETASRDLTIMSYDLIGGPRFKTESEKRAWMVANLPDIPLVDMQVIDISQFRTVALEWEAKRPTLDYEIDGLVVALDSIEDQEEVGWDSSQHHPLGKIAFKFKPEQKIAKVLGIDWQVGRTGRLTPMARIEPTLLAGSTIRNITLHNSSNVVALDVAVNDEVLIEKAGDIIPQVVRVVNRPKDRNVEVFVTQCPSCGGDVFADEQKVNLWCDSPMCPAKLERRVLHWIKTLDVMGVGSGIVSELCRLGFVKDVPDLYYLTEEQLVAVTGGKSSAQKAQQAILEKGEIPLAVFLDALGIDGLGTTTSKDVAKKFKTLATVRAVCMADLVNLPNIGRLTADKIVEGLRVMAPMIDRLSQTVDIQEVKDSSGPLKGMSLVLTGAMSKGRKEIEAAIEKAGGENRGSVGKGVTFLVQADPTSQSSKTEKAKKCGTQIISEEHLWDMINGKVKV